jgi:hypothetical protein
MQESDPIRITRAVEEISRLKPDYSAILDLYQKIFLAQEESSGSVRVHKREISPELLHSKMKEGFPLLEISDFSIDAEEGLRLFGILCQILAGIESEISHSAAALSGPVMPEKSTCGPSAIPSSAATRGPSSHWRASWALTGKISLFLFTTASSPLLS